MRFSLFQCNDNDGFQQFPYPLWGICPNEWISPIKHCAWVHVCFFCNQIGVREMQNGSKHEKYNFDGAAQYHRIFATGKIRWYIQPLWQTCTLSFFVARFFPIEGVTLLSSCTTARPPLTHANHPSVFLIYIWYHLFLMPYATAC